MRVEGTLYSLFADTELERITELEKEVEQQRYFTEKEKNETLKDVILLQDTIKEKDKTISEQ
jgi:mobilization protein bmpH